MGLAEGTSSTRPESATARIHSATRGASSTPVRLAAAATIGMWRSSTFANQTPLNIRTTALNIRTTTLDIHTRALNIRTTALHIRTHLHDSGEGHVRTQHVRAAAVQVLLQQQREVYGGGARREGRAHRDELLGREAAHRVRAQVAPHPGVGAQQQHAGAAAHQPLDREHVRGQLRRGHQEGGHPPERGEGAVGVGLNPQLRLHVGRLPGAEAEGANVHAVVAQPAGGGGQEGGQAVVGVRLRAERAEHVAHPVLR
eukprot:1196335-Prorocentrum_minimum.AAC.3